MNATSRSVTAAALIALTCTVPALASAAATSHHKAPPRPRAGRWTNETLDGTAKDTSFDVRKGGKHLTGLRLKPGDIPCPARTLITVSGSFTIKRDNAFLSDNTYAVGAGKRGTQDEKVTVHQAGMTYPGTLQIGFRSSTTAVGSLDFSSACQLDFAATR